MVGVGVGFVEFGVAHEGHSTQGLLVAVNGVLVGVWVTGANWM